MGNSYIRTSQTRRDNKRKSKEYIYNYVDRVRYAESSFPDYKCPSRGSGWRHNKSISHLDLATSCHSAAAGLNHWSSSHQTRHHQLRHSRSLDYNHIDRCKDALDIAEYYWRVEPEPELYDEEDEEIIEAKKNASQKQQQQQPPSQLKYVNEHHLAQHYRDFKCADENYHHSTNNIYQSSQQLQQQQQLQQTLQQNLQHQSNISIPPQPFDFASDSCSLRRSRSLAVIREETFSDLQISSSNGSRRSQLIPRARLVNRGYFRERDRLICGNNKSHHHHHTSREKLTSNCNCNTNGCNSASGGSGGKVNGYYCQDLDEQSAESVADTCESHQQQLIHHKQQQQQQQHLHFNPHYHDTQTALVAGTTNDYYEHLKRLDKLALGLVTEQLHPWHNDKSDLESLNSDYFKNSLHQSNDFKQNPGHSSQLAHQHSHSQQQQQQQSEFEAFEKAVHLLAQEKPRIYQSRRQKRSTALEKSNHTKLTASTPVSGGESCPENSQSSIFPETTTSNSDDQTDSASLSEQEYDITKIEEIFQKTQIEGDEESYEIISLTTTRTRIETTEDEAEDREEDEDRVKERDRLLEEQINGHRYPLETYDYSKEDEEEEEIDEAEETEESNRHTTTDTEIEGTLKRARAVSDNLQKIIAYDSVYLSSEESSDSTLIDVDAYDTSLEVASLCTCIDEVETLLHISIEDAIYEPQAKQHKFEEIYKSQDSLLTEPQTLSFVETVNTKIEILDNCNDLSGNETKPLYSQILKVEHTPASSTAQQQHTTTISTGVTSSAASKPKILSVVEKRKLKRYSDSAYSSNLSDSSEKALTLSTTDSLSASSCTLTSHLKRQVAEPLYIPLKTNLNHNQYYSLPDVNIGQSLKVSESIDAQLRSSYNLDNCSCSDDAVSDCQNETDHTTTLLAANQNNSSNNNSNSNKSKNKTNDCQLSSEEVLTSDEIYDSIKRSGKEHQKLKQKEIQELETQPTEQQPLSVDNFIDIAKDQLNTPKQTTEIQSTHVTTSIDEENYQPTKDNILHQNSFDSSSQTPESYSPLQNYEDSLEKSKDIPAIPIENFRQQIERRAKEIRASGRRTQLQHIEFANRAKFRLENTLSHYEDIQAETKEIKFNKSQNQASENSLFRIVVTDAQNNIIEEDSIERLKTVQQKETKDNLNVSSIKRKSNRLEYADELLMVRFSKERLKEKPANSGSFNCRTSGSLKRVPSKHRRQQYPITAHTEKNSAQHLSTAESKKLLLSPKSRERRVLSNQIYRARPVKVITTTTTTTTTTSTDSFRRNKLKHQSNKMSRPQILQVIDNKRKLENGLTVAGNLTAATTTFNANQIFHNTEEPSQAENEYLKKVDAVRCYWSKLVNNDLDMQKQQQQHELHETKTEEKEKAKEVVFLMAESETLNEQQKQQKSFKKETQDTNDVENINESQPQTQQQTQKHPHQHPKEQRYEEKKQFILGAHTPSNDINREHPMRNLNTSAGDNHNKTLTTNRQLDDYSSFMPSIEIVELDGDKKATIVSAAPASFYSLRGNEVNDDADINDATEPQFDHIRYKVLKSQQLLRSNVLARNKKEAQFDGLIQYLQEYSFQELLSNNNVVIVEPVRTKIERPFVTNIINNGSLTKDTCTTQTIQPAQIEGKRKLTKRNSNAKGGGSACGGSGGIKRHFFYQPVRVNRELYEEELPNPDTVRNVRKFFEDNILPTPGQGLLAKAPQEQQPDNGGTQSTAKQTSPKTRRARKYRYLTIDTSYGHVATAAAAKQLNSTSIQRKWDTASISSGISSGDLSSPCECNDLENNSKRTDTSSTVTSNTQPINKNTNTTAAKDDCGTNPMHVQDLVKKHNNSNAAKKPRSAAFGVPVRSSGIRPRSAIYGNLHNTGKSSNYRDIYEYNIKHPTHSSDAHEAATEGDADEDNIDENELFGDVDGDLDELCDTYYVSNDILRKIRECGSSVTYYGGRVVQTSAASASPLDSNGSGKNFNKTIAANNNTTMSLKNPTMMAQTQTRARVREIETCCNAATTTTTTVAAETAACNLKAANNESQFHGKQLEQNNFHLPKNNNGTNNESEMKANHTECNQNNVKHKVQGFNKADNRAAGITFKLVKSNSCSSRLELAGATDIEPEETEVVRKMVHHFEATKTKSDDSNSNKKRSTSKPNFHNGTALTINNQTTLDCQNDDGRNNRDKLKDEFSAGHSADALIIEKHNHDCNINPVTVNNHINISKENFKESNKNKCNGKLKEKSGNLKKTEELKMYQSEAKDIHLDNSRKGNKKEVGNNAVTCAKICRNKNVDLAFTFLKQQPTKSSGSNTELNTCNTNIEKQSTFSNNNPLKDEKSGTEQEDRKLVAYENTLLPTISATTQIRNSDKIIIGDIKIDGEEPKKSRLHFNANTCHKPSQIIVPVDIHRVDNQHIKKQENAFNPGTSVFLSQSTNVGAEDKTFLPLSTTSSATSVVDRTVVKHYVANDKSIYEKRKYDDIEFEEFEIYDPTKDFEKLIEEEQRRHHTEAQFANNNYDTEQQQQQQQQQQQTLQQNSINSSLSSSPSKGSTTSSLATAKSQQTLISTETETDCYDSLDDKL